MKLTAALLVGVLVGAFWNQQSQQAKYEHLSLALTRQESRNTQALKEAQRVGRNELAVAVYQASGKRYVLPGYALLDLKTLKITAPQQ